MPPNKKAIYNQVSALFLLGFSILTAPVKAQIVPDRTLPNNSIVIPDGNTITIDGGTQVNNNLFHSFKDFSILTDWTAFFNNSPNIKNIFTRVTGGKLSNIDGIIRANGTANLFFINPRGIVFGPNARLAIGGSFLGSTAKSIRFSNGFEFSAVSREAVPLITIDADVIAPIGIIFEENPEKIIVRGDGHSLIKNSFFSPAIELNARSQLSVLPKENFLLIGGDISIDGGTILAKSGNVKLGSVAGGTVNLNLNASEWRLDFKEAKGLGNITLSNRSLLNASGLDDGSIPGGSLELTGRKVELRNGSAAIIQNFSDIPAGNIKISASEVALNGISFLANNPKLYTPSILLGETLGTGKGGDIEITTGKLTIENGAAISSYTFSAGTAGAIIVNASDSIAIGGFSFLNPADSDTLAISGIGSNAVTNSGRGGNIVIETNDLFITNGGAIVSGIFSSGKGGDIFVNAKFIEIADGTSFGSLSQINSANFSAANNTGVGGNININTDIITLKNSGSVSSDTFGNGQAGKVTVNATKEVKISSFSRISSIAIIAPEIIQQKLMLPNIVSGNSGNVVVNTKNLTIENITISNFVNPFNFSGINVSNFGTGNAGTLKINAERIELNRGGTISAITTSGLGGSIEIDAKIMQLRRGSSIATDAGGIGNGGNININSDFITAVPIEDSNISANAFEGDGGKININAKGIFGLEFRKFPTPLSDITASSEFGVQGEVKINSLEFNSLQEAIELPKELVKFFDSVGCASGGSIQFFNIGRGGYLPNPQEPLDNENLIVNWIEPDSTEPIDRSQPKLEGNHPVEVQKYNAFIPACLD